MLSQSAYLFAAKVFGYGIRILLPVFLVRLLTPAEMGAYYQFFLIEVLLKTVFQMGVNQSQFFFIPRDPDNSGGYFVNSLVLNVLLFTLGYTLIGVFVPQVSEFLNMPILADFFWPLATYSLLMMLTVSAHTNLIARKHFQSAAIFEILPQLLASIATLTAAYLTRDLYTIILALVASRIVSLALILIFIHLRHRGFRSDNYFFGFWKQVRYGVVLGLAGMLWTFLMRMHEFTVSKFFDIETYAVYASGCKQIPILQFFAQSISSVALVRFAKLESDNDWQGIREFWDKILGSLWGVGIPLTIFFITIANPLVTLAFTSEYKGAITIFQINSVAMLFHLLNPTLVLRAMDRNDISLKVHLGIILLLPLALYTGMQLFGIHGIISAHAIMIILGRVANHFVLNRLTPVYLPFAPSWSSVLAFYRGSYQKVQSKLRLLVRN